MVFIVEAESRAKETLRQVARAIKEFKRTGPHGLDKLPSLQMQGAYREGWQAALEEIEIRAGGLSEWEGV